ncbi:MAG: hypothetical protein ACRDUV_18855 [Pseudonocardiaceae bacterium]
MLLDLRGWLGGSLPELWGNVVVLDDVESMMAHHEEYYALVSNPEVLGVVCVAVGVPPTPDNGVLLRLPKVLPHGEGIVLWVGDQHGVHWGPRDNRPRPVEAVPPSGLDLLVAALRMPEVFDQVVACVAEFPERTAGPGLRVVSGSVDSADLATARADAVRSLTTPSTGRPVAEEVVDAARRIVACPEAGETALLRADGAVYAAREDARRQVHAAEQLAVSLETMRAVGGAQRPGPAIGPATVQAAERVDQYRELIVELLGRIDGNLRLGKPPTQSVVELGVGRPAPVSREDIATGLRELVEASLATEPSHADVLADLRWTVATIRPQGCPDVLKQVEGVGRVRREVPAFRAWPLSLWWLPLVLLSSAAGGFLPGTAWLRYLLGALFALAWWLAGWLLLARRPDTYGECGFGRATAQGVGTYGVVGVVGAVGGVFAARYLPFASVRPATVVAVLALAALMLVVVTVMSWRSAARHFVAQLGLSQLRDILGQLTEDVQRTVAFEWLPSARRQVLAEAVAEVAAGLDEEMRTMASATSRLFTDLARPAGATAVAPEEIMRPVAPELFAVVRGDLVGIALTALKPAWRAVETGHRAPSGGYAQRTERLVGEYAEHVATAGLMALPPATTDRAPRDRYIARTWSESSAVSDTLRTDGEDDMVQLCRSQQLNYLRAGDGLSTLRFAPAPVRQALEAEGRRFQPSTGIVWTESGELAGSVRLLPLRAGTVVTAFEATS